MSNTLVIETTRNEVRVEANDYSVTAEMVRLEVEVNPSTVLVQAPIGFQAENKSGVALPVGSVVAKHASGNGVVRAHSDTSPLVAVGLLAQGLSSSQVGPVQTDGVIELSDWTMITGTPTLAANAQYYLSTSPGMLTQAIPTGNGRIVQAIGKAMNPTTLDISIMNPIWRN